MKPDELRDMTPDQVFALEDDIKILKADSRWSAVLATLDEKVEEMKHHLLFEADKSRDLDLMQGKQKGLHYFQGVFNNFESFAEKLREDAKKEKEKEDNALFNQDEL